MTHPSSLQVSKLLTAPCVLALYILLDYALSSHRVLDLSRPRNRPVAMEEKQTPDPNLIESNGSTSLRHVRTTVFSAFSCLSIPAGLGLVFVFYDADVIQARVTRIE
ncbi:hypothetical protein DFH08DRAFT_833217 [Mycena albidolilacea]|uniref:Uncharacterized protein n=1 Tax=Mycena albidolilacea TaxID=1033008 RepID=A0AAD7F520_9AGAR|nr:hypothetical protein DFH08DRAFT_833217 [Mycena albidolilacea]